MNPPDAITHRLYQIAGPIILANLATPLLGMVDTAVIGQLGETHLLGALALGAMIFNLVFWGFGFLRMGTTALVAQAKGRADPTAIRNHLSRSLLLAVFLGVLLCLLQQPIASLIFSTTGASPGVEAAAATYYQIRIWGAPLHLMLLAMMGYLLGQQASRYVLILQLILNLTNILLDLIFVVLLEWSVEGVAAATLIAEAVTLIAGFWILGHHFNFFSGAFNPAQILELKAIKALFRVNRDIMIRTLCLIFAFAWFTDQGARLGDLSLAANLILMQFVTFSAFFIDGFAIASESIMGEAHGKRDRHAANDIIRAAFFNGGLLALLLSVALFFLSPGIMQLLTSSPTVINEATEFSLWMVATPLISFAAYIYDGLFIGATKTAEMRTAMVVSLLVYLLAWRLTQSFENHGLWLALMIYYVARAVSLGYYQRRLYEFLDQDVKTTEK